MSDGELSLPQATMAALMARPDGGQELFDLEDRGEIVAWLDAHGLAYTIVPPDETAMEKAARIFGVNAVAEIVGSPPVDERGRAQRARALRRRGKRR